MENLPKLTKEQIAEIDAQIETAKLKGQETVTFPHIATGLIGLVTAGITAVAVAQDLGGRQIPATLDPSSESDLKDYLKSLQKEGKLEDISLSKLIELRNKL